MEELTSSLSVQEFGINVTWSLPLAEAVPLDTTRKANRAVNRRTFIVVLFSRIARAASECSSSQERFLYRSTRRVTWDNEVGYLSLQLFYSQHPFFFSKSNTSSSVDLDCSHAGNSSRWKFLQADSAVIDTVARCTWQKITNSRVIFWSLTFEVLLSNLAFAMKPYLHECSIMKVSTLRARTI